MKIIDWNIFFVVILFPIYLVLCTQELSLRKTETLRIQYDNAIDHAVMDGISSLIEFDATEPIVIDKDAAIDSYFRSAYNSFGITDSPVAQDELHLYTPLVLITDSDGFYFYYNYEVEDPSGGTNIISGWSEKETYSYQQGTVTISFTITDLVRIYDAATGIIYEGDYHDLIRMNPMLQTSLPFLIDEDQFESVRNTIMSDAISSSMEYYMNEHNRIAHNYGIKYNFFMPSITDEDWIRAVNGFAMLAVFQGYPYKHADGYYNQVEVAGARLVKHDLYYITQDGGEKFYHKSNCTLITDVSKQTPIDSTRECASQGASPCQICCP